MQVHQRLLSPKNAPCCWPHEGALNIFVSLPGGTRELPAVLIGVLSLLLRRCLVASEVDYNGFFKVFSVHEGLMYNYTM